ncbi:MAG: hypothetical protein LBU77_04410 [Clostridiales bacterium]|jgi:hypothetical protein|nr:hypothetical protein [Clostridiales bacterium]
MSRTHRKDNVRSVNKWRGYYLEDTECKYCLHYRSKKRGCALDACCCEDEKADALAKGRIKRVKGPMKWDM